ncbi:hypothetical protein K438DRAFT_1752439 [Mycena galopus ATCC 62051]|nr:hypothetical protein K438DRAFT_1752439 [Mycena galopus ATCC 62051]
MEQVLFWLSHLGFRVAWSANYKQLMERLFPDVLSQFPPAQRRTEFDRLWASLFISCRPGMQGQSGITPLDAPTRIARIYWIPAAAPDLRGSTPDPSSDVPSARGSTVRFSTEGILEYLDSEQPVPGTRGKLIPPLLLELALGDGRWVPFEESMPPGHVLVGTELDLWIIASGAPSSNCTSDVSGCWAFTGLPTSSPEPIPGEEGGAVSQAHPYQAARRPGIRSSCFVASSSERLTIRIPPGRAAFVPTRDPFRLPQQFPAEGFRPEEAMVRALYPLCKRCGNLNCLCTLEIGKALPAKTPRWWRKFSNAYKEGDEEMLREFRVEFWEHLGSGSFHPLRPDPRTVDWMEARRFYSYWEFLSDLRPAQHTTRAETRCKTVKKGGRRHGPTVIISSGSEDESPAPKKRKTSRAGREPSAVSSPEVIVVEDEEMLAADDMRNYDLDGDMPMPPQITTTTTSSWNPPPPRCSPGTAGVFFSDHSGRPAARGFGTGPHFLGFRLRPIEEFLAAARPTFVDEIVQWAIEGEEDETRVESALLFMSAIFSQAGNTLGQRRRNGKGKAREQ